MTKDQQATPIPDEELYNLTQLAEVTLAAGPLSTTDIRQIKDYMTNHEVMLAAGGLSTTDIRQIKDYMSSHQTTACGEAAKQSVDDADKRCAYYASSDDDSNYNYSHKVFDRSKLRRCTMSDSVSCASNSSISSNGLTSSEEALQSSAAKSMDAALGLLEDEHICPECGKKYSTSSNLARHRQTHRSISDKKARHCPYCEKVYVSMPAFSMHVRTHNQGCKCQFCGKCFSRPWLLQGHVRTHTGEKPFKCSVCAKAFADKSNLRAHIQTHSNTKPHTCARCGKAFALKSYLYKHEESSCMKQRHGERELRSTPRPAQAAPKRQAEVQRELATGSDSAKFTLANKLLQKEKERQQAALSYYSDVLALNLPQKYEQFNRISVIQPPPSALPLPHPNAVYQEHLLLPPQQAAQVTQEQPVDFSPKNNFTHSAKTSPFQLTGNYAMVA